jgi:hypothetical protein
MQWPNHHLSDTDLMYIVQLLRESRGEENRHLFKGWLVFVDFYWTVVQCTQRKLSALSLILSHYQNSKGTNVPQTFQKRSTNVPTSNRNETKTSEFVPESPIERVHFYLLQESRFWTKSKQSVLNKTNSGTIPKRFGFVSKTISERLSLRFWHYHLLTLTSSIPSPFSIN